MIFVGARSIVLFFLLTVMILLDWHQGILSLQYFQMIQPFVLFVLGFSATLFSLITARFIGYRKRSHTHVSVGTSLSTEDTLLFRVKDFQCALGENRGETHAKDLPALGQMLILWLVFFLFFGMTVDNRFLLLLQNGSDLFASSRFGFCPKDEPSVPIVKQDKLGCSLVMRAFVLGYVSELGDCVEEEEHKNVICDLRQWDEPYLHYVWRRSHAVFQRVSKVLGGQEIYRSEQILKTKLNFFHGLFNSQRQTVRSDPRASHHLWTNLYAPHSLSDFISESLSPSHCLKQTQHLSPTLSLNLDYRFAMGRGIQHAYSQLLFNPASGDSVGLCREYSIHWSTSANWCSRLAVDPGTALEEAGILGEVLSLLERFKTSEVLTEMERAVSKLRGEEKEKKKAQSSATSELVAKSLSFNCLWVNDEEKSSTQQIPFEFRGVRLVANETLVPRKFLDTPLDVVPVQSYKILARLLVPGFRYADFSSHESLATHSQREAALEALLGDNFPMTRLEHLKLLDLFLEKTSVSGRQGLLEIYPWHVHLYHFVAMFRQEYRLFKGRL